MLRGWAPRWNGKRVKLAVKSDSVPALTVHAEDGRGIRMTAREIALDVAGSVCVPTHIRHIPGVNIVAGALSRWFAPGGPPQLPPILTEAKLRTCHPAAEIGGELFASVEVKRRCAEGWLDGSMLDASLIAPFGSRLIHANGMKHSGSVHANVMNPFMQTS